MWPEREAPHEREKGKLTVESLKEAQVKKMKRDGNKRIMRRQGPVLEKAKASWMQTTYLVASCPPCAPPSPILPRQGKASRL